MIPELRSHFNRTFQNDAYQKMTQDIHASYRQSLEFRVCETPLFLSANLNNRLVEAAHDVIRVIQEDDYNARVAAAIPPGMAVAGEDAHPTFLQVDFALCQDENGGLIPQLIELQGFPSLYCYQHYLDKKLREYFEIPDGFTAFYDGLDSASYQELFGKALLGDSAPENVVLLEIEPEKQKTRIDFYLADEYYGIKSVCVTKIIHRGNKLYYKNGNKEIPIERFYHRFIFDELVKKDLQVSFRFDDEDIRIKWVGHPNWFFKVSKYTLPLIKSPYCPPCYFLNELDAYPDDLENYVLKPLFSFAGQGVEINVTKAMLDSITDRDNYLLQRKIAYAPFIKTMDIDAKAEVRMMFLWEAGSAPRLVNNLLRVSKGAMMGVDFNKNKTWVGSSLAYHHSTPA